jgi:poly(hydroxyalkanoate) depolymerase family esterase
MMKVNLAAAMREATRLTRSRNLAEATRVIQEALSARGHGSPAASRKNAPAKDAGTSAAFLDLTAHTGARSRVTKTATGKKESSSSFWRDRAAEKHARDRVSRPLGEVIRRLREGKLRNLLGSLGSLVTAPVPPPVPDGAEFVTRSFSCQAGSRTYKLYVPGRRNSPLTALVVMLHGCTQNPDDFATGTRMNEVAEEHGFLVAYPAQPKTANPSSCWNWFNPKDQLRDAGEPAIIAGLTRAIVAEFNIDSRRVFVAGLSAGGAMAVVMGANYPELYSAIGIHSGLPHGAAADVVSAFAAMRGEPVPAPSSPLAAEPSRRVRTIVFHGDADQTVHPSNGERIIAAAFASELNGRTETETGSTGGRDYVRSVTSDSAGVPLVEHWQIGGAGHAWAGGSPNGSYTDPKGPNASREMVRFFLEGDRDPNALGTT